MKIKISACTAKGSHIENQDCLCATGLCPEQTSFWADRKEVEVPFLYATVSDGIGSGAASTSRALPAKHLPRPLRLSPLFLSTTFRAAANSMLICLITGS